MHTSDESLMSLVAMVVANCDEIGSYIQNTTFIVEKYEGMSALHGYNSGEPFEYLKEWCWTRSWDEYFSHVMDLWDEDNMSAMRFNALIERLSGPASRLDVLVPKLERECRRFPNMPESVLRNAKEMQSCVNSFLNSADDGLNLWKRRENILVESEIRQRRPIVMQDHFRDDSESVVKTDENIISQPERGGTFFWNSARPHLSSLSKTLTSDLALLAFTGIFSITACIIEGLAFSTSTQLHHHSKGNINDPDFLNALQTFLMQILAVYTVLAPAFRSGSGGPRYEFWTWLLAILSLATGTASLALYTTFPTLTPLLACVSNVLQAFVTLALVFAFKDREDQDAPNVKMEVRKEI